MSGGTFVPRNECPGGHFFQGDSHSSDTVCGVYDWGLSQYMVLTPLVSGPNTLRDSHVMGTKRYFVSRQEIFLC